MPYLNSKADLILQRMFREMVPGMVNVLEQCLAESDEENAGKGFEVFDTLLMLVSAKFVAFWSRRAIG